MAGRTCKGSLDREALRRLIASKNASAAQRQLAGLRLTYSEDHTLLVNTISNLHGLERIYPRHYPGQASGRTSTIDPPITNWPRACVNQHCPREEHEWTKECWSIRDIQLPDEDEILLSFDHDNIEGKIHDLIVADEQALEAHREGYDLHTITCCAIFGLPLPQDLRNPHTSAVDAEWRRHSAWQGKDTKRRVLAKNFNHGSKYARNEYFVYKIQGIEKYGLSTAQLRRHARTYIASKGEAWTRKLAIMDYIRRSRIARTLYGFKRMFYDSSEDTGKEGFSHMVSGTVSDYNNLTISLMHDWLGEGVRLLHNAHDGDKFAIKATFMQREYLDKGLSLEAFLDDSRAIIERPIAYDGRSLMITAQVKVAGWPA